MLGLAPADPMESMTGHAAELEAMKLIHAISTRLLGAGDLPELLREILGASGRITGTDKGNIQLVQPGSEHLQIVVHQGHGARFLEHFAENGFQGAAPQRAIASLRTIVEDLAVEHSFPELDRAVLLADGIRAMQATPLVARSGQTVGVLSNFFATPHQPGERELRFLDLLARMAADLIERARSDQALRESERRFAAIFNQAAGGLAMVDLRGGFTLTNERFCQLVGRSAEELSQMRLHEITHADDLPHNEALFARAVAEGGEFTIEKRYLRPDGTAVWVMADIVAIRDNRGRTSSLLAVCQDITGRKQTENLLFEEQEKLRKSEQRYRSLFDSIDYGFCVMKTVGDEAGHPVDFRFVECNPAFVHYTGFPDAPGKTVLELVPDLDREVLESWARVVRTGERERLEYRAAAWDRWFDMRAFRFGKPSCGYLAVLFKDITRRKQAEARERYFADLGETLRPLDDPAEVVREATRMLGATLGASRVVCCEVGFDGETFSIGRGYADGVASLPPSYRLRDAGLVAGDALRAGRRLVQNDLGLAPELDDGTRAACARLQVGAQVAVPLLRDTRLAGLLLVQQSRARTWSSEEIGVIVETAERTWAAVRRARAEFARRESEARFRDLADNISQIAWIADAQGGISWLNRRWTDYTGVAPAELSDQDWKQYVHPEHTKRVFTRLQRSWESGEPWEDTFPLRGREGGYRWFLSRAMPIRNADGAILRWFGTCTDVTRQRAAEEALKEAARRKDEFLATLGHELRNPLAPVRYAMQILRAKGSPSPEAAAARDMIDRQVSQMVRLIDDLLDVSRITMNKLQLRPERMELSGAIAQAVEATRLYAGADQRKLEVRLPSEPVYLYADPARLAQVFDNLLSNAYKYTDEGGQVELSVELVAGRGEAPEVLVRVRDDGIGVPSEHLSRLFEKFWQAAPSLERSQGGLGVGLAMVQGLVELHGGTITAHSAGLGRGSEFVVRLPALSPEIAVEQSPAPSEEAALQSSKQRRILVVDDNRDSAESLAMLLRFGGDEVETAFDGIEALELAERFRPHIALLDIGMPRLNGYDTCRRLREQTWGQGMVLIAQTGWGQEQDRQRASEAGFDGHLVKPVDYEELTRLLVELSAPGDELAGARP
jgi:PAS domain S-box-containing protein